MATPVVTVASGGLAVVDVTASTPKLGLPVTEALNGRGMAVTKVAGGGMPVTYSTVADYPGGGGGGGGTSAEVTAFLARTSGLDTTHTNAYTALIDGLVADGVWSKLDMLHVYATQDSTTAKLNLVSTSYNGTANGSPTFTADRGFTGTSGSSTVYIDTGFIPSTAPTPKYNPTSCHFSVWSTVDIGTSNRVIMGNTLGSVEETTIYTKFTDNKAYFRANDAGVGLSVAVADSQGHYIANNSTGSAAQGYKNGASIVTGADTSNTRSTQSFVTLGTKFNGAVTGAPHQTAMASIGGSLNATEAGNFYARLRTYMTAVGVP